MHMGASAGVVTPEPEAAVPGTPRLEVFARLGDVHVVVRPPQADGAPVGFDEARRELRTWPLQSSDPAALAAAVRRMEGKPCACGRLQPSGAVSDESAFAVVVDTRRRAVFAVPWARPEAPPIDPQKLQEVLAANGVRHGLDETGAARLAAGPWRTPVQVARLGDVEVEAESLETAKREAARILGVPVEEVHATVERTEHSGGVLRRGHAKVHVRASHRPGTAPVDGRFELHWKRGEVWLTVHAAAGSGSPVEPADVLEALAEFPPVHLEHGAIESAVRDAAGTAVKIAGYAPRVEPADEATAGVWVTDDALVAFLVPWTDETPAAVPVEVSQAALEAAGVRHGVDEATLTAVAQEPLVRPVVVARATPAVHGVDASVEWQVTPSDHAGEPLVLEDGSIDYHELSGETEVTPDTVLAVKHAAVPGTPGRSVLGQELQARAAKDLRLEKWAGPGVAVKTDGTALVAQTAGMLARVGEKLAVTPVRAIRGDVDFKVGNVSFNGSVVVHGNVKPGFRIHATGSVQVDGEVDSAVIEAEGDVKVRGGIVGENGSAKSGGSLRAGYLHSVDVEAAGPVTVDGEVWQCRVTSGDTVTVKGRIVGGSVQARRVIAETLGASVGTPTRVDIQTAATSDTEGATPAVRAAVIGRKHVYPGVTVAISRALLDVDTALGPTQFHEENGQIESGPPTSSR